MATRISTIQKYAWGFAAMFLGVYSLDYVPGIMDANGKMFGLFSMTTIVDIGHLALGALAVLGALLGAKASESTSTFWACFTWETCSLLYSPIFRR
ncbi:MAG: hypothetical protein HY269_01355 [Deltaproteobacteria bacterium]|nr:hypothetical protein [Deltaproteobacteria bacterium]